MLADAALSTAAAGRPDSWSQQLSRRIVMARDHRRCRDCGAPATVVHHLVEHAAGVSDEPSNLIALCDDCHRRRHGYRAAQGWIPIGRRDCTPWPEPPSITSAVPNWGPGDTIPLGQRTLRVVRVRDDKTNEQPVLVVADVAG